MGQKTHPIGFRLGSTRTWSSRWFATKNYAKLLHEDVKIRRYIKDQLYHAGIAKIDIERSANRARISISTARPGIIIGRKGSEVEKLKNELQARTGKEIYLNIEEVIHPELDAQLVAENVALQLQKRVAFRRAMKKAVTSALRLGADGIRIACAGRLGGGEIARREWYRDGRVPLHTIRADIDYGLATAHTTYGTIGVKVWIFKGMKGTAQRGAALAFGEYGLKALEPGWVTNRQIEAARVALSRSLKRGGKIWIRIFPDKPVTKKPAETRMGKGKGNPEEWVAVVKPGRIIYEMQGVPEDIAREAFRTAAQKMGIATRFVMRTRAL
ncbi:MAG: hypothetical protein DME15_01510 [Candidatus Rokuibacteriota bacterium]|nr:MAG: hypothetical protein DME15_01510 [Candidatus Rokubacteria bacterium]